MRGGISAAQYIFHRAMVLRAGKINFTAKNGISASMGRLVKISV